MEQIKSIALVGIVQWQGLNLSYLIWETTNISETIISIICRTGSSDRASRKSVTLFCTHHWDSSDFPSFVSRETYKVSFTYVRTRRFHNPDLSDRVCPRSPRCSQCVLSEEQKEEVETFWPWRKKFPNDMLNQLKKWQTSPSLHACTMCLY